MFDFRFWIFDWRYWHMHLLLYSRILKNTEEENYQ